MMWFLTITVVIRPTPVVLLLRVFFLQSIYLALYPSRFPRPLSVLWFSHPCIDVHGWIPLIIRKDKPTTFGLCTNLEIPLTFSLLPQSSMSSGIQLSTLHKLLLLITLIPLEFCFCTWVRVCLAARFLAVTVTGNVILKRGCHYFPFMMWVKMCKMAWMSGQKQETERSYWSQD